MLPEVLSLWRNSTKLNRDLLIDDYHIVIIDQYTVIVMKH